MATIREISIPLANYPSGTIQIPQRDIPDTTREIYFEFLRCTDATPNNWENATTQIKYDQEISFDGGNTWVAGGGFEAFGGIHTRRDDTQSPITTIIVILPLGINRKWRATVQIINGPCRTQGTIEMRD